MFISTFTQDMGQGFKFEGLLALNPYKNTPITTSEMVLEKY